ncbi:MAG TPA: hypothetical protein VHC97_17185 [Thermoanaerobaculia bacterium]|nr:hypothetical protein [Thermoanaerobaculia bacterium]
MAEDWRTQGKPQTVKVEAPESSAAALPEEMTQDAGDQRKPLSFEPRRESPAKPRPPKIAVLAIHGMGQQIPFETVDQVQRNFCAAASRKGKKLPKPSARIAKVGGEVLRRAEIPISAHENEDAPEVHFYEAYWAPLTEGRVGLRDVISFLRAGGSNGLKHSSGLSLSNHFLFGQMFPFPRSIRRAAGLALSLLAVISLVILNAILLAVAAGTNWLPSPPGWFKGEFLQDDMTGVASLVCLFGAALGACLFLAMTRRDLAPKGGLWRLPASQRFLLNSLFYLTLVVLIISAVAMVWLVRQHTRASSDVSFLNPRLGGDLKAWQLATVVTAATVLIALIALAGVLVKMILGKVLAPVARLVVTLCFFLVSAAAAVAGGYLLALILGANVPSFSPTALPAPLAWIFSNRRLWVWTVLIGLSATARSFLVQYLGDVALYVSPHKLDRFNETRDRIREEVFKTACALYAARTQDGKPEYDQVALVGHSLGSVVAYDTLNYLINKDLLSDDPLGVNTRTCLLLTFGSPLDKIAYLFQIQGTRTSDTREALANAAQPLVRSYDYRKFKWINVFSKDDIISGSLEFFDDEKSGGDYRVKNEEDPYSSIPLVAHTEYWRTSIVWDHLYDEVVDHLAKAVRRGEDRQREAS